MNRQQVIAIAKSVDVRALETSDGGLGGIVEPLRTFHMSEIQLERFAVLVAAAEREACAELMEQQHAWITNVAASALIRARNTNKEKQ